MSHDQKPGKVRVVGGRSAAPSRRHDDLAPGADETGSALAVAGERDTAGEAGRGRSQLLLAALFVAGCAIGGVALPLVRAE